MTNNISSLKNIVKSQWTLWLSLFLVVMSIIIIIKAYQIGKDTEKDIEEIEYIDDLNNFNKLYYENQFKSLKKENKELYDSLKKCKEQVEYLVQFTYEKKNATEKVIIKDRDTTIYDTVKVYQYTGEQDDTFKYKIDIGSYTEPVWYKLETKIKEKFTIINKNIEGNDNNHLIIGSEGNGNFSDVTAFKRKETKTLKDRLKVGPSVGVGYDPINKRWGMTCGIAATFDVTK